MSKKILHQTESPGALASPSRLAEAERERDLERSRFAHHGEQADALNVEIQRQAAGEWGHLRYRVVALLAEQARLFKQYAAGQPSPSNWRKRAEKAEGKLARLSEAVTQRIGEIRARCEKATQGPWAWESIAEKSNEFAVGLAWDVDGKPVRRRIEDDPDAMQDVILERRLLGTNETGHANFADAAFIAAAREDIPWLLEQLEDVLTLLHRPHPSEEKE